MPAINVPRVTVTVGWAKWYRTRDVVITIRLLIRLIFFSKQDHVRNLRKHVTQDNKETWNGDISAFFTMFIRESYGGIMNRLFTLVFVLNSTDQRWTRWYHDSKVFQTGQDYWIVRLSFQQINHVCIVIIARDCD